MKKREGSVAVAELGNENALFNQQVRRVPRLIRMPEVQERVGLSRSTIYGRIAANTFPAAVPLGERSVAWLETDIDEWIHGRLINAGREVEA